MTLLLALLASATPVKERIDIGDRSYKVKVKGDIAHVMLRGVRTDRIGNMTDAKRAAELATGCKATDSSVALGFMGTGHTGLNVQLDCTEQPR